MDPNYGYFKRGEVYAKLIVTIVMSVFPDLTKKFAPNLGVI